MSNKTPEQLARLLKFTLERMKEKVRHIQVQCDSSKYPYQSQGRFLEIPRGGGGGGGGLSQAKAKLEIPEGNLSNYIFFISFWKQVWVNFLAMIFLVCQCGV